VKGCYLAAQKFLFFNSAGGGGGRETPPPPLPTGGAPMLRTADAGHKK